MTDWNTQVVKIEKVINHPNADALDLVTVLGDYPVIVKRGEYKVDDLACYLPIDTIVPDTDQFYFLSPKAYEKFEDEAGNIQQRQLGPKYPVGSVPEKYRILKAKKIRNVYSQGMLVPVPENSNLQVGDNIAELLLLKKWEEEEEDNIPNAKKSKGANAEKPPVGWSIPHYDVEGLRKYINCLAENEEIVLTEKIHGCFKSNTTILLADGSKKAISKISVGEEVLGQDESGNITPTKVLNVWNNGISKDWLKVKVARRRIGSGSSYSIIDCTSNHKFYSPTQNKYIPISEFKIGDKVSYYREDISIPEIQKQILLGKILGDGSIGLRDGGWAIWFGHTINDLDYFEWTERGLGELFLKSSKGHYKSGYGSDMIRGSTIWSYTIREEFNKYIDPISKKKIISSDIIKDLTPLSIAFWYMDDGSLSYADEKEQECAVCFATCSFTDEEHKLLQQGLLKFNIESYVKRYDNQLRLFLNAKNAEKLFLLVAPYIPKCMERKLPMRYRGGDGWLPPINAPQRFSRCSEQEILEITKVENEFSKWDLETETHNYFAKNILVHNSNASFCHDGKKLWTKSRNFYKKMDEDDPWWDIAIRYDLVNKLAAFPMKIFFGELYGNNKGFRYDCQLVNGAMHSRIKFFDVCDAKTGLYLDYDDFTSMVKSAGLETVPELYRGKWLGKEVMYPYAEGPTTLGGKHTREGFVLRTTKERFEPKLNSRMCIKLVGEGYNLAK